MRISKTLGAELPGSMYRKWNGWLKASVNIDVRKVILSRDDRLSSGTMVDKR